MHDEYLDQARDMDVDDVARLLAENARLREALQAIGELLAVGVDEIGIHEIVRIDEIIDNALADDESEGA